MLTRVLEPSGNSREPSEQSRESFSKKPQPLRDRSEPLDLFRNALPRVQSLEDQMDPEISAMVPEANTARTETLCQTNH